MHMLTFKQYVANTTFMHVAQNADLSTAQRVYSNSTYFIAVTVMLTTMIVIANFLNHVLWSINSCNYNNGLL